MDRIEEFTEAIENMKILLEQLQEIAETSPDSICLSNMSELEDSYRYLSFAVPYTDTE